MKKHIPNIITFSRILGSILLLFFPVFSLGFYITYVFCGLTDMIDGTIARKIGSAGNFGATLDTIADLIFMLSAFAKIFPRLFIPAYILIWTSVIAIIKTSTFIFSFVRRKNPHFLHSTMNKIVGAVLFIFPFTISFIEPNVSLSVICLTASITAISEAFGNAYTL